MLSRLLVLTLALICVAQCDWISADLELPRVRPAVAQVANKLYIAGGQIADGIETASIEVLNTDTFEFEDINLNLPSPRQQCSAVPIGSKIFYSGGLSTPSNLLIFNETNAVFSLLKKAPWVHNVHHIQILNSSAVCVFGDGSLDIFNLVTQTWTTVQEYRDLVKQIFKFGFGVVNNTAFIVGGVFPNNGTLSPNVWTFDLLSHKLTCHQNAIAPQYFPNGMKLSFSAIGAIMTGGVNKTVSQLVNIYNWGTNKWLSTNCLDLNPALNALPLITITDSFAYIAIDAKTLSLNTKVKLVNLATLEVSLKTLPLINGAWTSLVAVGDKVLACGKGSVLSTYYIFTDDSFSAGFTLNVGFLPELSFEVDGKFLLLAQNGNIFNFDPKNIVAPLTNLLTFNAKVAIDAKVIDSSLVIAFNNGDATTISAEGNVNTENLSGNILGIFGDQIVTDTSSYLASTLAKVKDVSGQVPALVDIGRLDSLPGLCTVLNSLEKVVERVSQKIDVYDTISNSWSTINIATLTGKTLAFAGKIDDCLIYTASNVAYVVNTTKGAVQSNFVLDNINSVVDDVRAFVQAPQVDDSVYVGIGGNLAEVTLTSSDLTVRANPDELVINHMALLDDVIYVADIESTKMYFYNVLNNTWNSVSLAGNTLVNYALAAVNDTVVLVGGNNGVLSQVGGVAKDLSSVILYHPVNASITVLDLNVNARSEITPYSMPDAAVFIGGQNSYGQPQSTVDIYSARASDTTEPTGDNSNPTQPTNASGIVLANLAFVLLAAIITLF